MCGRVLLGFASSAVANGMDIGGSGDNFDWISEQFLDLYYLYAAQSVSVRI